MHNNMEVPRRPGQRPARLPPQPQSQHSPVNDTSSGSTTSSHRRQHSPYYLPHYIPPHLPAPFLPYPYPFSIYPYPPHLYPLPVPPTQHPFATRPLQQRRTEKRACKEGQSPGIRPHGMLRASPSLPLVWLISHFPEQAQIRRSEAHHSHAEAVGPSLLAQPATDPPVQRMCIVSNDFMWEIPIEVRPPAFITVEAVLFGIFAAMHEALTTNEWESIEEPNIKRNAHWARCSRLAKGESLLRFSEETSTIRRVDLLGDKVAFKGLAPLPISRNRIEFLLQLGSSTQANDKRTRMRRGSF